MAQIKRRTIIYSVAYIEKYDIYVQKVLYEEKMFLQNIKYSEIPFLILMTVTLYSLIQTIYKFKYIIAATIARNANLLTLISLSISASSLVNK